MKRPIPEVIEDDQRLDEWYEGFKNDVKEKLIDYYKKTGEKIEGQVMPKRFSRVIGDDTEDNI